MSSDVLWNPPNLDATNWARFARQVGISPDDLQAWSIENTGDFWTAVWDFGEVIGDRGDVAVESGDDLWDTRFFPEARLNVAENLLRPGSDLALIFRGESAGDAREVSRDQLRSLVAKAAAAMREAGLGPGDRVAAWLPNLPETYVVMLAAASIGAVFTSTSPDFGVDGVLDRFQQVEPKLLVGVNGYRYGGRVFDRRQELASVVESIDSLVETWVVPFVDLDVDMAGVRAWDEVVLARTETEPIFERLPFDHPWYVLYSSGTTGKPKCIVHRAGGLLLKHLTEHLLHTDVRPTDRLFYFTTAGWMMWNWLASGLATGATVVLYDGSPFHPDGNRLFDLLDEVGATLFGTSAKFIESVEKAGLHPVQSHGLDTVRTIASTGSPLVEEGFRFVYESIAPHVHLASISGGTDLCGCLVAGNPTAPVVAGEIQAPTLGLDTQVVDDDGQPTSAGVRGELVCRNAFPSMPLGFWNDPNDQRYHGTYFERFGGMWHQGDFAERTPSGGFIIHGRSDATLNPGGVRIGTAEIYRLVDRFAEVLESLVVGQQVGADVRVVLFVKLRDHLVLDDDLRHRIQSAVRAGATPRHVPAVVAQIPDIPRTRSGKSTELAVRELIHGRPVKNIEALANPEVLDAFVDHPDLA
ncbi:MAG: acetoacetate--CoA ligase [Actinomycetia bacterium]|nr:acetoacetate--CoA ligase [Actinomycetes bacterium]